MVRRAKLSRYFRNLPSLFLVLVLVVPPHAQSVFADDKTASAEQKVDLDLDLDAATTPTDADAAKDLDDIDREAQARVETTKKWSAEQEAILPRLLDAAARLEENAKQIEQQSGRKKVDELVNSDSFIVDLPDGGTAEYRQIDGQYVPRVLYGDNVYMLIDEKLISRDSAHLRQNIARTHIESGLGRSVLDANGKPVLNIFGRPKKQGGRDLTIVFFNDDVNNSEIVSMPKARFTQWEWWKDYYLSKKKAPSWNDFTLAIAVGAMQAAATYGLTLINPHHGGATAWEAATFTGLFALTIGTFTSFYKRLTNKSLSIFTRTLKRQFVSSMPFAYGLTLAFGDGDLHHRLAAISFLTAAGLATDASLWMNGIFNNIASSHWNKVMELRDNSRAVADKRVQIGVDFTVGAAKKTWKIINWSWANAEYQLFYMIPWILNQVGLMLIANAGTWTQIPFTSVHLPIVQFAGIPIAMFWAKWYARRLADTANADPYQTARAADLAKLAQGYEASWGNLWDIKSLPERMLNQLKAFTSSLGAAVSNMSSRCRQILTGG